ncbi:hypothetical protein A3709_16715 [Halioglobus sp. HI00S01]|uniref:site-specific integrase n=1 Tax=Halioglobus sp. HI00S01 TaxID=1822214 RepID=UPI0007C28F59|nr:site-specific integrase [Halioglobus sp. HI00S01]KZX59184.1 hypothetical protein A3709_16715 [Halioglobus sp. HI00S01]
MNFTRFLIRSRHGSTWYVRVYIPKRLQPLFHGKKQIKKSTGYRDKRQAGRVAAIYWAQCQALFDELALQMSSRDKPRSIRSGLTITTDALGREHRFDFGGDSDPEAAKQEQQAAQEAREATAKLLEQHRDNLELIQALVSANTPAATHDPNAPETVMTWDELFSKFEAKQKERANNPSERYNLRSFDEAQAYRNFWKGYFAGREVHSIKRTEIEAIEDWLQRVPSGFTKKSISIDKAIELAKSGVHDHKMISGPTYNHYQRQLKWLLQYAHRLGAHRDDLSVCIRQKDKNLGKKFERMPFTDEDMALMFCGENYTSNFGRANPKTPFAARFWVPLLAAFSGARMDELCQLKVCDVMHDEATDIHYLNIAGPEDTAPDGQPKRVKNRNSIRPIPIHPALINIGFLEYADTLRNTPEASLFGLQRAPEGKWGSPLSKWFTNKSSNAKGFIERCGIVSKGELRDGVEWTKTFHGLRHTVTDNLRDKLKRLPDGSRVNAEDIGLAIGHLDEASADLETHSYGQGVKKPGVPA